MRVHAFVVVFLITAGVGNVLTQASSILALSIVEIDVERLDQSKIGHESLGPKHCAAGETS